MLQRTFTEVWIFEASSAGKNSEQCIFGDFHTMHDANQFAVAYWVGLSSRPDVKAQKVINEDPRFPFQAKCNISRPDNGCLLKVYEAEVHQLKTDKISNILSEINFSRIIRAQEKPRDVLLQELQPIQTAWKALPEEQRESDFSITREAMIITIRGKPRVRKRRQRFVNTERKRQKVEPTYKRRFRNDPWDFSEFVVPSHLNSAVQSFESVWREGMKTPRDFALLKPDDPIRARLHKLQDRINIPITLYYAVVSFGLQPDGKDFNFSKGLSLLQKIYEQWTSANEFGGLWEFSIFLQKEHNINLKDPPKQLNDILVARGMKWSAA